MQSLTRSAALLVLWVGIGALMPGVTQVFLAFEWRHVHKEAERASSTPRQREHVDAMQSTFALAS